MDLYPQSPPGTVPTQVCQQGWVCAWVCEVGLITRTHASPKAEPADVLDLKTPRRQRSRQENKILYTRQMER